MGINEARAVLCCEVPLHLHAMPPTPAAACSPPPEQHLAPAAKGRVDPPPITPEQGESADNPAG